MEQEYKEEMTEFDIKREEAMKVFLEFLENRCGIKLKNVLDDPDYMENYRKWRESQSKNKIKVFIIKIHPRASGFLLY